MTTLHREIPAGEFKQHCLSLMNQVAETGVELVITKRGTPLCRLAPLSHPKNHHYFGWMKDTAIIKKDITKPTGEKWKANK